MDVTVSGWRVVALGVAVTAMLSAGCASTVTVAPMPPEKYEVLGATSGDACGVLLVGDWFAAILPLGLSERMTRATERALAKVPGATALVNVTVEERWYYWFVGSSRCVTVNGEAIRS